MAAPHSEFVAFVLESLGPLGGVSARRMFGGYGIFKDGLIFAIVVDDQLYLKVDDTNRAAFDAAGLAPFTYVSKGRPIQMSYREAPGEGLDDPEVLGEWVREAFAAALRAHRSAKSPPRHPRSVTPSR